MIYFGESCGPTNHGLELFLKFQAASCYQFDTVLAHGVNIPRQTLRIRIFTLYHDNFVSSSSLSSFGDWPRHISL